MDFRRSVHRADPMQPILAVMSVAEAVVFALNASGKASTLAWVAIAVLLIIGAASVGIAEPIN